MFSMSMRRIVLIAGLTLISGTALAEEVRIGHLETNDDTGINWLFFRCEKSDAAQMQCDIFQTLIGKKSTAQIADEWKAMAATDLLAEFNKQFGEMCKPLVDNESKIAAGLTIDGKKPSNPRLAVSSASFMKEMIKVCKSPTQDAAIQLYKSMSEKDRRSCKVHSNHRQVTFNFDYQTNSWISREGPTGPCGTFVLGTLTKDPANTLFWTYVERVLRTNPQGTAPILGACSQYPARTLNYSWHTSRTLEGCEFIESQPD